VRALLAPPTVSPAQRILLVAGGPKIAHVNQ
jgi:hypothetical protein